MAGGGLMAEILLYTPRIIVFVGRSVGRSAREYVNDPPGGIIAP